MAKVNLTKTWIYNGKHYGPGAVEIADAEVAKALTERERMGVTQVAPQHAINAAQNPADGAERVPAGDAQQPLGGAPAPSVPRRERAKNGGEG
jgi:hypothetical protein